MADYPIPGAGVYGQAVEMAKTRYQQRLADLNKTRQGTMRSAGFTADINDQGLLGNLRTDPYNQYGAYQQLNRAQAQRFGSVEEENIGRGLGVGGGLAAQRMNDSRYQAGQEDAQFGQAFQDQLSGLDRTQQDYRYEYDAAMWQAQQEAARQAIESEDFYPVDESQLWPPDEGAPDPGESDPWGFPQISATPGQWNAAVGRGIRQSIGALGGPKPTRNRSSGNPMQSRGRGTSGYPKPVQKRPPVKPGRRK